VDPLVEVLALVLVGYLSVSFGRWIYDVLSVRYPAFRRLEKNRYVRAAATAVAVLVIVSVPLLLPDYRLSLRYAHIIAPALALLGFLAPLGLPGWLEEALERRKRRKQ